MTNKNNINRYIYFILIFFIVHLQAMSGFLMMMTQNGKLLYISDNAAEYLGHSMVSKNEICIELHWTNNMMMP